MKPARTLPRSALSAGLLAAVSLAGACTTFDPAVEESHYRYDAENDALRIVEIQRGLVAGETQKAVTALQEFLDGRRRFPPQGGLFTVDLDQEVSAEDRDDWGELLARLEPWAENVRVAEAGLFLDDAGRLSAFRVTEVGAVREGLALLSDAINGVLAEEILAEAEGEAGDAAAGDEKVMREIEFVRDVETARLWRAHVREGRAWFEVQDGAIALIVPTSAQNAARQMQQLLSDAPENPRLAAFFAQVGSVEVAGGRAVLRFTGRDGGWSRFVGRESEDFEYDGDLAEAVRAAGRDPAAGPSLAEVRARAGL